MRTNHEVDLLYGIGVGQKSLFTKVLAAATCRKVRCSGTDEDRILARNEPLYVFQNFDDNKRVYGKSGAEERLILGQRVFIPVIKVFSELYRLVKKHTNEHGSRLTASTPASIIRPTVLTPFGTGSSLK